MLKSRLSAKWKTITAILVFIGVGGFFLYGGIANAWDEYELIHKGETVGGFIIDAWEDAEEADSGEVVWHHGVIYTYQLPDGRNLTGELHGEGRLKTEFRYLSEPYPVQVTYLPANPVVSRIAKDLPDSMLGSFRKQVFPYGFLSVLFFVLGFYLLWGLMRELKNRHQNI